MKLSNEVTPDPALQLSSLPYLERRIQLRSSPNNFPRFFYRYLGPSIKDEWLYDYLVDSKIYLKPPMAFNDPFDMKLNVIAEATIKEKRKHLLKAHKKYFPRSTRNERRSEVKFITANPQRASALAMEGFETLLKNYGVCCFSTDPRNVLMWSHYGQNHNGIALQFDYARDPVGFSPLLPVIYSNDYPTINYFGDRKDYSRLLIRKYRAWEYEEEWRIVKVDGANTYHPFDRKALTGVILGCRAGKQIEDRVRAMITDREKSGSGHIKIYRAKRQSDTKLNTSWF